MYITAMTHRDELFDLTLRWLNDDPAPGDGRVVTRIVLYESVIMAVVVNRVYLLLQKFFGGFLQMESLRQKHLLRECILQYLPHQNRRTRQLVNRFRENPEYFFPRVPIDALVISSGTHLAAISRIKRLSRVAEKAAFRLVDSLSGDIRAEAQRIAGQREAAAGLTSAKSINLGKSEELTPRDLREAETVIARRFRNRNVQLDREALAINDLIGFKLIGGPDLAERIQTFLDGETGITIAEIQEHNSNYKAINLLVDIELSSPDEMPELSKEFNWGIATSHGLDPAEICDGFAAYVSQGAKTVRIEFILTTYDELLESEFGRSMHELRILKLREHPAYHGPLARNAGYLMEYLLALAAAPITDVPELPVKMYGRYLPDSIVAAKCTLFGNNIESTLLNAYCLQSDCPKRFCPVSENPPFPSRSGGSEVEDDA